MSGVCMCACGWFPTGVLMMLHINLQLKACLLPLSLLTVSEKITFPQEILDV